MPGFQLSDPGGIDVTVTPHTTALAKLLRRKFARYRWQLYLRRTNAWARHCVKRQAEYDAEAWKRLPPPFYLLRALREHFRLGSAKVQRRRGFNRIPPEMAYGGLPGFRSCTTGGWDNTIRALEEDR